MVIPVLPSCYLRTSGLVVILQLSWAGALSRRFFSYLWIIIAWDMPGSVF